MKIAIAHDSNQMRANFIEKFVLTWEQFQAINAEWLNGIAKKNYTISYNELHLWDKMQNCQTISFADALNFLKSLNGDVFFMSESETFPYCKGIAIDNTDHKGVVAKINACELAGLIEYEWYEGWRLSAEDMYLENPILPEDLYVFDSSMEHMLVFTHENDNWELEIDEPMKAAQSRVCMAYGFDAKKNNV